MMTPEQLAGRARQRARLRRKGLLPPIQPVRIKPPAKRSSQEVWLQSECACGMKALAWHRDGIGRCDACLNRDTSSMRRYMS